jgi:uncharacterized membrane protein YphA (DoxX/SURF4 family)
VRSGAPCRVSLVTVRPGTIIIGAYIVVIVVAIVLGPLVVLRGYRTWWVALFYAIFLGAAVFGTINHYRGNKAADG